LYAPYIDPTIAPLRLGWDKNENYSVTGALNSHINMVVFELERATRTEGELETME